MNFVKHFRKSNPARPNDTSRRVPLLVYDLGLDARTRTVVSNREPCLASQQAIREQTLTTCTCGPHTLSTQMLEKAKRVDMELRTFDFSKYPRYFDITLEAGQYAWKPIIVLEVLREASCPVMW